MHTFTDSQKREWRISLNLGTAINVKTTMGVDLLQPELPYRDPSGQDTKDEPLLTRLGTDEWLLGEVICALLGDQFDTHQLTPAQVREAFDGQTLLAAQKAFYEELIDFFHKRGRNDRAKAVAKQMAMIDAAVAAIETRIDALDVNKEIDGVMSGSLQESSESIPGR